MALFLAAATTAAAVPAASAETIRILAFGDSLTAGYGLPADQSFPVQLQSALDAKGLPVEVINAGVSGDTTAGGLARLEWGLSDDPDLVLLELGANDGLRGIDPAATRSNLAAMLQILEAREIPTILAGMLAPPNLGNEYGSAFNTIYPDLADRFDITLYPFFLEGVAAEPSLNQGDGIHPNGEGVAVIVESIAPLIAAELVEAGLAQPPEG